MIDLADIKQLAERAATPTFSLYLRVDNAIEENQAETPAWRIYAKNAIRDIEDPALRARVQDYFESYTPSGKGLVLLYGADWEQVYELPVAPIENRHKFGHPLIAPLVWLIDEYERYLVVLVDKDEAHFLTTYLGLISREEAMVSERFTFDFRDKVIMPRPTGPDGRGNVLGGTHRDAFEDKMDDYIARFHNDVAERTREMLEKTGTDRLIIGGSEHAAHSVRDRLANRARKAFVDFANVPLQESDKTVMERVLPLALNHERAQELDLVNQVKDFAKAGGRGALGRADVAEALSMQQVEVLVAAWPYPDETTLERMTLLTLRDGGRVELVHGAAAQALNEADGIAARLYYTIKQES